MKEEELKYSMDDNKVWELVELRCLNAQNKLIVNGSLRSNMT